MTCAPSASPGSARRDGNKGPSPRGGLRLAGPAAALVLLGFVAALSGCASSREIPEFELYRSGFDAVGRASEVVFTDLEAAERAASIRVIRSGLSPLDPGRDERERLAFLGGLDETFRVEEAVYFAPAGVPPGTAAFRRALGAVAAFNDTVAAYADGRGADEIGTKLAGLDRALGQTGAALGLPVNVAGDLLQTAVPGLAVARVAVGQALEAGSLEAFRQAILATHPQIDALLLAMRDGSPTVFRVITSGDRAEAKDALDEGDRAAFEEALARVEAARAGLSIWVLALERSRAALAAVVAAIAAPVTSRLLLGELTESAGALELLAREAAVALQGAGQ